VCALNRLNHKNPAGYMIGASYKIDLRSSLISACIEALRRASMFSKNPSAYKSYSLKDFNNIKQYTFDDHGRLALDCDYSQKFLCPIFQNSDFEQNNIQELDWSAYTITDLVWPYKTEVPCPFYFAKAESSMVQNLFTGPTKKDQLNQDRLKTFSKGHTNIITAPHPFD
ncbi:MAG: hypothetical protein ACOYOK_14950, partial [Pseudobdellovibrionaceae bacterium]